MHMQAWGLSAQNDLQTKEPRDSGEGLYDSGGQTRCQLHADICGDEPNSPPLAKADPNIQVIPEGELLFLHTTFCSFTLAHNLA